MSFQWFCVVVLLAISNSNSQPIPSSDLPFYIEDTSLGSYYPYVVHKPSSDRFLPAVLMLHGTGSRTNDTSEITERCEWNGIGRRLKEYKDGSRDESPVIAAESFITIMPIAPNETRTEWELDPLYEILDKVYDDHGYDRSRLYIMGYSMGGRDGWKMLLRDPSRWAGAALSAGEPDDTYGSLAPLSDIPIRHYHGNDDYDSTLEEAENTQQNLMSFGATNSELVEVESGHNDMADIPFSADLMFNWLLEQSQDDTVSSSSSGLSGTTSATISTPTRDLDFYLSLYRFCNSSIEHLGTVFDQLGAEIVSCREKTTEASENFRALFDC